MSALDGGLAFVEEEMPAPLKEGFAALLETLRGLAGDGVDPGCSPSCSGRPCTGWRR